MAYRYLPDVLDLMSKTVKHDQTEMFIRFAEDGAKMGKANNSVKGVLKILTDRADITPQTSYIPCTQEDEITMFFFIGKHYLISKYMYIDL